MIFFILLIAVLITVCGGIVTPGLLATRPTNLPHWHRPVVLAWSAGVTRSLKGTAGCRFKRQSGLSRTGWFFFFKSFFSICAKRKKGDITHRQTLEARQDPGECSWGSSVDRGGERLRRCAPAGARQDCLSATDQNRLRYLGNERFTGHHAVLSAER